MPTQHPDLFAALAAPFEPHELKHRSQAGKQLSYITARTAMNRLDSVVGPENWWDQYVPGEKSVLCRLTLRLPDGQLLTKCDAGGYAGMSDEGDDDKSGYSDAFKRACVKFGVGRYLYRDGVPTFGAPEPPPASAPASNGKSPWPGKGPGSAGVSAGAAAAIQIAKGQCNGPIEGGPSDSARPATARQLKTAREIAGERGISEDQLARGARRDYGVDGLGALTRAQASDLIARLQAARPVDPANN
jgi:Rad52/22 family double-strand break repair protein